MFDILRRFLAFPNTVAPEATIPPLGPPTSGLQPNTMLTFEETVAQLSRGYENTQRVVQFMDAKAGAVITLCLAIFIVTGKLVVGAHDRLGEGLLVSQKAPVIFLIWGMTVLVLATGVLGFITLHFAFKAVRPNSLPKPEHFSTLFPAGDKPWENSAHAEYLQNVVSGELRNFVLKEYREQLLAMGHILYVKIYCLRAAIRALWWQGVMTFLLLFFVGVVVGFGWYPQRTEKPASPLPVKIVS